MPDHKHIVLFLTNSELGQASVHLAVAHELASQSACEVHIASFPALKQQVDALNASIVFHTLLGRSMKEALADSGLPYLPTHAPGARGAVESYCKGLQYVVAPWDPAGYEPIYRACLDLLDKLNPDLIAVDPLFGPGEDACNVQRRRYLVLSPATFKDHLVQDQPYQGVLWKYPVISSGLPYPLPLLLIAINIYLIFKLVFHTFLSARVRALTQWRNQIGIPGDLTTIYANFNKKVAWLMPSIPQSDFPIKVPANVTGCGPIIPPFESAARDQSTASWLAQRPTILFNLGSHMKYKVDDAQQVITALSMVLGRFPDAQVLWKCQLSEDETNDIKGSSKPSGIEHLIPAAMRDRIRVTSWITPSPMSILAHDNAIMYVHHGGSNSFHEALAAGVPQVVCPVWLDTYDFAARVEYLGVGVRGNKKAAPHLEGEELGTAICEAMNGIRRGVMSMKAKELQGHILAQEESSQAQDVYGVGRRRAAKAMLEIIQTINVE
ncbi:glycosyltransferase [Aspergillus mulundensis]|uniref:UDP-glucoronosyl and UDP-glucosyl transferase family protein n=1 Tax=Aspergillus mulundensis TaxID=1810919 RepID=A0A3D8SVJ2_9EURO|nr:hypothetical protein DSM5745_02080 [Aspergillus mulundensis]RDW90305.1 hypothetical protein DSM5745_02080 [Aspergillus mulundensis]